MFHFSVLPFQKIGIAILTSFLECPMKRALRDLGNSRIYTAVSKKKNIFYRIVEQNFLPFTTLLCSRVELWGEIV